MNGTLEYEGRRDTRVGYSAGNIKLRCSRAHPFHAGTLLDVSSTGCGLSTDQPLGIALEQIVELHLDLNSVVFRALAVVRRINPKSNKLGLEFHRLSPAKRAELEEFLIFFAPV